MNKEFEKMPIKKLAIKTSIPMIISMISIALYQIIDTMFVSKIPNIIEGANIALVTISLCIPVISIITAISLGTSIGVNSILARTLGEKKEDKVKKIIFNGILLIFLSWLIIFIISILGVKPFFNYFSSNSKIRNLGCNYLYIISIGSFGSMFQILFEKILEAYGKSKESMFVQFSGAIINLILDPILIFGIGFIPALGIKGAAIATIIGQILGMLLGIIYLFKYNIISLSDCKNIKFDKNVINDIYKVGFPTIILETACSFITLILNKILINFSDNAVSFWGIYSQLQKFVIIIVYGLNYAMIPIIAYNYGAKNKKRINESISFFTKLSLLVTFIGMLLFMLIPKQLVSIYNVNDEVIKMAIPAFRILSIGFMFAAISLGRSAISQALGNGTNSLIINLSRQIIFSLPLILILKRFLGINSIWISFTLSEIITMIISIYLYKKLKIKTIDNLKDN